MKLVFFFVFNFAFFKSFADKLTKNITVAEANRSLHYFDISKLANIPKISDSIIIPDAFINVSNFPSINAAVNSIGGKSKTLIISNSQKLSGNLQIPSNISLIVPNGGYIDNSGYNLKINGPFEAGRYRVFSDNGKIIFGNGAVEAQYPEWDGADNTGVDSTNTTKAFHIQYSRNLPISLGIGTYKVDSIATTSSFPLIIIGRKQDGSFLQLSSTSAIGIWIASNLSVSRSLLKNFTLYGTPLNSGGVCLGGNTTKFVYSAFTKLENIEIENFSKAGSYAIRLNQVQELDAENLNLEHNYNNIFVPSQQGQYVTATTFRGRNSYIGRAANRGVEILGKVSDISFEDVVFEGNSNEAIYYNNNDASSIYISNCYFEENSKGGSGCISITGGLGAYQQTMVKIRDCNFHFNVGGDLPTIRLENVWGSSITGCIGLWENGGIEVNNNVRCYFSNNSQAGSAANMKTYYSKLLAISPYISADDYDDLGNWFHVGKGESEKNITEISGTYLPTLTKLVNVASSRAFQCQYYRIGNTVSVSGMLTLAPVVSNASTEIIMSLPIKSTFTAISNGAGTAFGLNGSDAYSLNIKASVGSGTVILSGLPSTTKNIDFSFYLMYLVQ
jgi:hypothetical protein